MDAATGKKPARARIEVSPLPLKTFGYDLAKAMMKDSEQRYSRKTVPLFLPKAELALLPGWGQCACMAAEPKVCVEPLKALPGKDERI